MGKSSRITVNGCFRHKRHVLPHMLDFKNRRNAVTTFYLFSPRETVDSLKHFRIQYPRFICTSCKTHVYVRIWQHVHCLGCLDSTHFCISSRKCYEPVQIFWQMNKQFNKENGIGVIMGGSKYSQCLWAI